jgi:hypothetical protein
LIRREVFVGILFGSVDVKTLVRRLLFDETSSYLHTDRGITSLDALSRTRSDGSQNLSPQLPSTQGPDVSVDEVWMICNDLVVECCGFESSSNDCPLLRGLIIVPQNTERRKIRSAGTAIHVRW